MEFCKDEYTTIDVPSAIRTTALAINYQGQSSDAMIRRPRKSALKCMVVFFRGTNCSIVIVVDREINLYGVGRCEETFR